ncbi:MAG: DNA polymerase III subunit gamma/tau [Bacteroidetes bacterium]|nr:DNA polymerase III subunit gamma/tau [Bacteroidota bacterium]
MSFVVTARKWRPQTFNEVVGQEHITQTLKNAILKNRIAHAFIFAGPRGVGKTTTARILAKSLNCTNPHEGEPCNECDLCISFHNSQSLDIIEIDGASNRRIEEIRTLRESVKYAPSKGTHKIYIIDEVHMLTTESFNALLKTLEEPPEHTIFIFATTDIHKVPLTIISRCQRFDFRRIEIQAMKDHLAKIALSENIKIDDQSLTLIAKKADGALRDAQSLFDQVISFCGEDIDAKTLIQMLNLIDEEVYFKISDAILEKDFKAAFDISREIYEKGWNFIDFINGLVEHFRNIFTVIIRKDSGLIEGAEIYKERYISYESSFSEGDMLRVLAYLNKINYELKSSTNHRLKMEVSLSHLIGLEKTSTLSDLMAKIESGESFSTPDPVQQVGSDPVKTTYKKTVNIQPVQFKEPEVNAFVPPAVEVTGNFQDISAKWSQFIQQVNNEKFTLGGLLSQTKIIDMDGSTLNLEINDPADIKMINSYKGYYLDKTKEIFGSEINFEFTEASNEIKGDGQLAQYAKEEAKKNPTSNEPVENSKLVDAIINDLGGKEI